MKAIKPSGYVAVLFLAMNLASCQSVPAKDPAPDVRVDRRPPADVLVKCPELSALEDDSFGAVVRKLHEVLGLYKDCASRHSDLVDFVGQE